MERRIIHIDMDAFYAAIEQRDNPHLRGQPVIIGGRSHSRGVVSTASYEAREFGVHSAMPMAKAVQLCPQGVTISPNIQKYRQVSQQIMGIFGKYTDLVEALSLDEAFLDVTGSVKIFGDPITIANTIKKDINKQVELTCSIGIGPNKFLAKLASDLEKPNGMVVINTKDIKTKLWPLPIRKLWGIGPKSALKLEQVNIRTIGQVANTDINVIVRLLGSWGIEVHNMANGIDARPVIPEREAHSIGHEITFGEDTKDGDFLKGILLELAQDVGWRLRRAEVKGKTIVLKIRYQDFKTITRSITLETKTDRDDLIYTKAFELFERNSSQGKSIRLIGITVSGLSHQLNKEKQQISLFQESEYKSTELYQALDKINTKYGEKTVTRAR